MTIYISPNELANLVSAGLVDASIARKILIDHGGVTIDRDWLEDGGGKDDGDGPTPAPVVPKPTDPSSSASDIRPAGWSVIEPNDPRFARLAELFTSTPTATELREPGLASSANEDAKQQTLGDPIVQDAEGDHWHRTADGRYQMNREGRAVSLEFIRQRYGLHS